MSEKKRVAWVDIVKYFCIFFVMLSHLGGNSVAPELRQFYSSFFLTGFLFVSGYTYKFRLGFKDHFIKKVKQLLVPWFTFSMLSIVLSQMLSFKPGQHDDVLGEIGKNFLQVRGYGDGIWFVSALFVAYTFMYFFIKGYENYKLKVGNKAVWVFGLIAIALFFVNTTYSSLMPKEIFPWNMTGLPWHIEYVPYVLCFMFAGYLFKNNFEIIYDQKFNVVACIICTIVYLVLVYVPSFCGLKMPWYLANPCSFIKSFTSLAVFIYVSKHIKPNKYLLFVGQNTLIYFGLHGKVLSALEMVFKKVLPTVYEFTYNNHAAATVYSIGVGLFVSVVLIIPTLIINNYLPFMMGRSYKKMVQEKKDK